MTAAGFEPAPLRHGALSHRLRPLGQTVLVKQTKDYAPLDESKRMTCILHIKEMTLAGLEPAIFGSEDQRLIH